MRTLLCVSSSQLVDTLYALEARNSEIHGEQYRTILHPMQEYMALFFLQ